MCHNDFKSSCTPHQVSGLPTNVEFLKRLARHPAFVAAELDTSFIAKHLDSLTAAAKPPATVVAVAAVARHLLNVQVAPVTLLSMSLPLGHHPSHRAEIMPKITCRFCRALMFQRMHVMTCSTPLRIFDVLLWCTMCEWPELQC